jgi:hypothetical protein
MKTMRKLLLRRVTEKDTHMADPLPYPGTPRWVKVSGIVALVVVLLFVIMMLIGRGGRHGPGRHIPSGGGLGGHTPPIEHGVQQL